MRKFRIFSIIVFILSVAAFGYYKNEQVNSRDNQAPVISMDSDTIQVSCSAEESELLWGITAQDTKDGDVTDSLIIESLSNFVDNYTRNMTVVAFDSDNHASKASRKVSYTDYTPPVFSLTEPLRFASGTEDIMGTLTCTDQIDGDLTNTIKMSSEYYVQVDTPGEYPMVFSVANSAGDVQRLPVTIEIYDPSEEYSKPAIELSEYLVYTTVGNPVNPWDYVSQITYNGIKYVKAEDGVLYAQNPSANLEKTAITAEEVQITDQIDSSTAGVYEALIQMTNTANSESYTGQVRLIVVVR